MRLRNSNGGSVSASAMDIDDNELDCKQIEAEARDCAESPPGLPIDAQVPSLRRCAKLKRRVKDA